MEAKSTDRSECVPSDRVASTFQMAGLTSVNRRDWLKATVGGGVGLALGGLIDMPAAEAAARQLKLANVSEFTTSCNFCSCGCGMVAAVRDGKLLTMEGDYDHIVNRGSLCVKGISMFATHTSPNRLTAPRYRAPGSDHWEDISWDDAIARVAQKIRKTRDENWIATEKVGDKEVPVNRTDASGCLGGAQNTNEECYLFQKAARLLGLAYVEHQARL
jgi:formate dehydrogenase major subunit